MSTAAAPLKIAIAGASGRMGQMLIETTLRDEHAILVAAFDLPDSPMLGRNALQLSGALPASGHPAQQASVAISSDVAAGLQHCDCFIDFTRPAGTLQHLQLCTAAGVAMVIGTTGFNDAEKASIGAAAEHIPIVFSPNMAVGVNVMFKLLEMAARIMQQGYDIEIVEAHHRLKIDAPSGTALKMGEVIAETLQRELQQCAIYGREGVTGVRDPATIGFSTIRGGDIVGDHTAMFCGIGERVEITHKAASRMPYALGSLRAAHFLRGRKSGLFDMQDVLQLR